ncbi:hypothetical protein IW140_001022 [Coemansia sp. RSA 1813]|nr:hypothetical protein IW138_001755 [Coemansia sp. RSA 986]KAJ2572273.1 hypothetical protein IW140_001022 [Coemansia sp. RSA 1813]
MLAGGLAGATALLFVYPLDLARTRLALDVGKGDSRMFTGFTQCLMSVYKKNGICGLYQGYGVSVIGVMAYRALFFGGYDTLKQAVFKDNTQPSFLSAWLVAQAVTIGSGFLVYPFDTIRGHLMMQSGRSEKVYRHTFDCICSLYNEAGFLSSMKDKGSRKALGPVTLGYSEGGVESTDLDDPLLCRLGGKPVWLDTISPIPSHSTAICKHCGSEMLLLVQTHAPLNDSPYDRVMYIWACNRRSCSGKPGATAAIRAHILNTEYALKLVKHTKSKPKSQSKDQSTVPSFSKGLFGGGTSENNKQLDFGSVWNNSSLALSGTSTSNLFTGSIFGKTSQSVSDRPQLFDSKKSKGLLSQQSTNNSGTRTDNGSKKSNSSNDVDILGRGIKNISISLSEQVAEVKPVRVEWPESTASVQAKYLTFEAEYLEKPRTMDRYRKEIDQALDIASAMNNDVNTTRGDSYQPIKGRKANQKGAEADSHEKWADELYERDALPKGTDSAFSRFVSIAGQNSEQVMRYQYGGIPLIYSMQDSVAKMLVTKVKQPQKLFLDTNVKSTDRIGEYDECKPGGEYSDGYEDEDGDDDDDGDDDSMAITIQLSQKYSAENLPHCPFCNGRRTFECQLMPALLTELPLSNHATTVLQRNSSSAESSNQRRLVGSQLLQSFDLGVEFGTMMVFVCENDCHGGKTGIDYLGHDIQSMAEYSSATYYKELVLVQQEVHID